MNKLFILSLVLTYVSAIYASDDSLPIDLPVSDECKNNITNALGECQKSVKDKWINSDLGKQMASAVAKNDTKKQAELEPHLKCCAIWDGYDCIQGKLGGCNEEDRNASKVGIEKGIKDLEAKECLDYKHKSGKCSTKDSNGSWLVSANYFGVVLAILSIIFMSWK